MRALISIHFIILSVEMIREHYMKISFLLNYVAISIKCILKMHPAKAILSSWMFLNPFADITPFNSVP